MSRKEAFSKLARFISLNESRPEIAELSRTFRSLCSTQEKKFLDDLKVLQPIYEEALRFLESHAAEKGFGADILAFQRDLYKEWEQILSFSRGDRRHNFLIVIPVADRPLMLRNCLTSLIEQCRIFSYGGLTDDTGLPLYKKISVLVFDDSKDKANTISIKKICSSTAAAGVRTIYVGSEEQTEVFRNVPPEYREKLSGVVGYFSGIVRPHKGASLTRNIASLYIHSRLHEFGDNILVWFIDSDEEFKIKIIRDGEIGDIHFINYFYWLDRIFSDSDAEVLTGKVVGDPPVTPAVMIDTFLDDIISFLVDTAEAEPEGRCVFHTIHASEAFSAEYHDMVGLFGYKQSSSPKKYSCSLQGDHSLAAGFDDFSNRSLGFFYGLHPTRTQFYSPGNSITDVKNARTVYTGNYVITPDGLRFFIPFAALGLRMAGPTLGRILRRKIKGKFVSANLPLLHKRTLTENYMNEFRSGIVQKGNTMDLSGEFQRQFWGDIMLFSAEALCDIGYPEKRVERSEIADAVGRVQGRIWNIYKGHQATASAKAMKIRQLLSDPTRWWNGRSAAKHSVANLMTFASLVDKNFGAASGAIKTISDQIAEGSATEKIIIALNSFYDDERAWNELLKQF